MKTFIKVCLILASIAPSVMFIYAIDKVGTPYTTKSVVLAWKMGCYFGSRGVVRPKEMKSCEEASAYFAEGLEAFDKSK